MNYDINKIENGFLLSVRKDNDDLDYGCEYHKYAFKTWDEVADYIKNNPIV